MSQAEVRSLVDRAWRLRREALEGDRLYFVRRVRRVCEFLHRAADLCHANRWHAELSVVLGKLGHVESDLGRTAAARTRFEESVRAARASGDAIRLAHSVRHLGDIHRRAGRLDDAEACYLEALALYRASDEPPTLDYANAVRPLALMREGQGRTDEAQALWESARQLYARAGVREGVAECARHLSATPGR